jgi:hypothetical protein
MKQGQHDVARRGCDRRSSIVAHVGLSETLQKLEDATAQALVSLGRLMTGAFVATSRKVRCLSSTLMAKQ